MDNMIERVARAMVGHYNDHRAPGTPDDPRPAPVDYGAARAAIEAMREPTHAILRAMTESEARDDEGTFPALMDLIDFSGENKTRTVLSAAWSAAIDASLSPSPAPAGERL